MLKLGRNDVLADVTRRLGNALGGQVVGFAGAGSVDDFRRLHAEVVCNRRRHPLHLGTGLLPGNVGGIGIGNIPPLGRHIGVQHGGVCRGVGRIVKIDHGDAPSI